MSDQGEDNQEGVVMDKPIEVFYVDHTWNQRNEFWQGECEKCG